MNQTCEEEAEMHVLVHPKTLRYLRFSILYSFSIKNLMLFQQYLEKVL